MLTDRIDQQQMQRVRHDLIRTRAIVHSEQNNHIVVNALPCINFTSNDYLGLTKHPELIHALQQGAAQFGVGGSASSIVSGYSKAQHELEIAFAEWLHTDKALLFNSGYHANLGLYAALCQRHDIVYADKLCHASILDGLQLSRATLKRYQHNNIEHLKMLIHNQKPNWLVTESVFSMAGDIAPIKALVSLAKHHQANLIIDDAHGIGVLGDGRGIISTNQLTQHDFTCLIAPLGKAFHGMGAIVAGRAPIIDTLIQSARSYHYTTALPPALCVMLHKSLKIIQQDAWRREQLMKNIAHTQQRIKTLGLPTTSTDATPIISIILGTSQKAMAVQQHLLQHGYFVSAIRPPTVPNNTARIRLSLNSLHNTQDIDRVLQLMAGQLA